MQDWIRCGFALQQDRKRNYESVKAVRNGGIRKSGAGLRNSDEKQCRAGPANWEIKKAVPLCSGSSSQTREGLLHFDPLLFLGVHSSGTLKFYHDIYANKYYSRDCISSHLHFGWLFSIVFLLVRWDFIQFYWSQRMVKVHAWLSENSSSRHIPMNKLEKRAKKTSICALGHLPRFRRNQTTKQAQFASHFTTIVKNYGYSVNYCNRFGRP